MTDYSKNKILFIVQLPPPIHGASIMNSLVVNSEIVKQKFSIEVINLQFAYSIANITKFSIKKVFKSVSIGFEIYKKIKLFKPNLVYFTISPKGYAFYRDSIYVLIMKMMNMNIIFHIHMKGIKETTDKSRIKNNIYKYVFKNTNVICLSKSLIADFSGILNSIPYIVPNGIHIQQDNYKTDNGNNEVVIQLLFLSNYMRSKGVLVLMEALNILNKQGYKFHARFVGAPFDLTIEFLESLAVEYKISNMVEIVGPLYGDDKIREFHNASIFIFPTFNEAFPLVLLEASQFGLPVISTFEGGIPDIVVDGETGFLVDSQNSEMLAEKIAILLNNKDMRIEMGKNAHNRFMNNFTFEIFEMNMLKTFNSILNA